MAVLTLGAVGGLILGTIGWFNSLPPQFKYLIFLGGLLADVGLITGFLGFQQGVLGGIITFIMQGFVPGIIITSFHLLVIFSFLPLIIFMLNNSLAHQ